MFYASLHLVAFHYTTKTSTEPEGERETVRVLCRGREISSKRSVQRVQRGCCHAEERDASRALLQNKKNPSFHKKNSSQKRKKMQRVQKPQTNTHRPFCVLYEWVLCNNKNFHIKNMSKNPSLNNLLSSPHNWLNLSHIQGHLTRVELPSSLAADRVNKPASGEFIKVTRAKP